MVAEQDEKLKAALYDVVGEMTPERTRIEIRGTNGLTLRIFHEQQQVGETWRGLARTDGGWTRTHLQLEDKRGELLSGMVSPVYPDGTWGDANKAALMLSSLVDRLVEGSGAYLAMASILSYREVAARTRARRVKEEIARLGEIEKDLEDAEAASGWLAQVVETEAIEV